MIEVRVEPTGDSAEVETPEEAVVAARALIMDGVGASPIRASVFRASFYVRGKLIRGDITYQELSFISTQDEKSTRNLHCKGFPESLALGSGVCNDGNIGSVTTLATGQQIKEAGTDMAAKTEKTQETLAEQLMKGFTVKSRTNGSVHTIKAQDGKTTVGEVCVGKKQSRLNFKKAPDSKAPKGIELSGKSNSWKGGGVVINEGNLAAARKLIEHVVKTGGPAPAKAVEAVAEAGKDDSKKSAQSRVRNSGGQQRRSTRSSGAKKDEAVEQVEEAIEADATAS